MGLTEWFQKQMVLNVLFPVDFHQLMKGFTILLGSKGTDMEQMSMREHPISELTG
jgi:hypothetical protein